MRDNWGLGLFSIIGEEREKGWENWGKEWENLLVLV